MIKKYLEDIFEEIGIDPIIIDKISNHLFTQKIAT